MKNRQILQMKYHPAKKEVEFRRFQNEKEIAIRDDSRLTTYMAQKGTFILQDYGNEFFEDIGQAFDGLKVVEVQVITTKTDYEDFVRMVEYYNEEPDGCCKIEPTLLAELPDMGIAFEQVKKHGEDSIRSLERYKPRLVEVPQENENVRKSVDGFRTQLNEAISDIREKINSLGDNRVSLCFTGVYSAGKSALINALLGYRILPESIESKTAKMFRISSPKEEENEKIIFDILSVPSELEWNPQIAAFEFSKGPSESPFRTNIQQKVLNNCKGKKVHEQILEILSDLNVRPEISSQIDVHFPVALDNEKVQFMIYDTPGTDSNYKEHQDVLLDALNEQTQSILIFVAKPDGLEGTGNNTLLNYLREAEKNNAKTSIDISRSLFVINKADGQTADARRILQRQEIKSKEENGINIQLSNKKLFFTSALYAYISQATRNGVATDSEKAMAVSGKYVLALEENPIGHCYRQDRSATSEFATNRLIERCEQALQEAQTNGDEMQVLEICSGLYALKNEILQYGEKYASAVKAYAIIKSVETVLSNFNNRTKSFSEINRKAIEDLNKDIEELESTIAQAIEREHVRVSLPENKPIPQNVQIRLKVDGSTLQSAVIGNALTKVDGILKHGFFSQKVKVDRRDKENIKVVIKKVVEDFTADFLESRKKLLEEQSNSFISAVQNIIRQNGNISDTAKSFVSNIPAPIIGNPNLPNFGETYEIYCKTKKILFFESEYFDKEGFMEDVRVSLLAVAREMTDKFKEDYRQSLNGLIEAVESRFQDNLGEYSVNIKALHEEKSAMLKLGEVISDAASSLSDNQERLNNLIWREMESANA